MTDITPAAEADPRYGLGPEPAPCRAGPGSSGRRGHGRAGGVGDRAVRDHVGLARQRGRRDADGGDGRGRSGRAGARAVRRADRGAEVRIALRAQGFGDETTIDREVSDGRIAGSITQDATGLTRLLATNPDLREEAAAPVFRRSASPDASAIQLTVGSDDATDDNVEKLVEAFSDPAVQRFLATDPSVRGTLLPLATTPPRRRGAGRAVTCGRVRKGTRHRRARGRVVPYRVQSFGRDAAGAKLRA